MPCTECVKLGDTSIKELFQCPLCRAWFCAVHLDPKFAIYSTDAEDHEKDPIIRELMHQNQADGHP